MHLGLEKKLASWVLGEHPNNTLFAFNWHNVRHIRRFLAEAALWLKREREGGLVFADIGAGRSPYYSYFRDLAREYVAIDRDIEVGTNVEGKERRIVGSAECIPLASESTDVVLCNQVMEHGQDPTLAIREIYRILKPNGCLIGSVPHISPIHLEPYDFRRYTRFGLESLLRDAGFDEVKIEGSGGAFSSAAFIIGMDLLLGKWRPDRPQHYSTKVALVLSPLCGVMNVSALLVDTLRGDSGRTAANLCWTALKPSPPNEDSARLFQHVGVSGV